MCRTADQSSGTGDVSQLSQVRSDLSNAMQSIQELKQQYSNGTEAPTASAGTHPAGSRGSGGEPQPSNSLPASAMGPTSGVAPGPGPSTMGPLDWIPALLPQPLGDLPQPSGPGQAWNRKPSRPAISPSPASDSGGAAPDLIRQPQPPKASQQEVVEQSPKRARFTLPRTDPEGTDSASSLGSRSDVGSAGDGVEGGAAASSSWRSAQGGGGFAGQRQGLVLDKSRESHLTIQRQEPDSSPSSVSDGDNLMVRPLKNGRGAFFLGHSYANLCVKTQQCA
jgi:hypothetical protein